MAKWKSETAAPMGSSWVIPSDLPSGSLRVKSEVLEIVGARQGYAAIVPTRGARLLDTSHSRAPT